MNTKRQTVWLVSMLSLMVVLSAYYLFTDDTEQFNISDEIAMNEIRIETQPVDPATIPSPQPNAQTPAAAEASDNDVLQKVMAQNLTGSDFFAALHMKRTEDLARQTEKWMTIVTNTKEHTAETVAQAYEELEKISEKDAVVTAVEETLLQDFRSAIVTEGTNNKWKVIVQAGNIEKSQVVSIIDLVTDELQLFAEQVEVTYVP